MDYALTIDDFKFVTIKDQDGSGYYSYKWRDFEVCLLAVKNSKWLICLANKYEEVLDEVKVSELRQALIVASEYHRNPNLRFDVI